jgi:hypothetical protein
VRGAYTARGRAHDSRSTTLTLEMTSDAPYTRRDECTRSASDARASSANSRKCFQCDGEGSGDHPTPQTPNPQDLKRAPAIVVQSLVTLPLTSVNSSRPTEV